MLRRELSKLRYLELCHGKQIGAFQLRKRNVNKSDREMLQDLLRSPAEVFPGLVTTSWTPPSCLPGPARTPTPEIPQVLGPVAILAMQVSGDPFYNFFCSHLRPLFCSFSFILLFCLSWPQCLHLPCLSIPGGARPPELDRLVPRVPGSRRPVPSSR